MANSKIHKLIDLVEDVKKVDAMIMLHKHDDDSDFMLSQYRAKKVKLTGELIGELNAPPFKSTESFILMKQFLDKFYTDSTGVIDSNNKEKVDLRELEAVL